MKQISLNRQNVLANNDYPNNNLKFLFSNFIFNYIRDLKSVLLKSKNPYYTNKC